jgi:transposase-like protein
MRIDDAVDHYKTAVRLAEELGIHSSAISNWRNRYDHGLVPELYARRLHEKTRGKLRFDREAYTKAPTAKASSSH